MARCATCNNNYHRSFDIMMDGQTFTFDSFECAINKLAPRCAHCGCTIIGHGVGEHGQIYCCQHCASQ